MQHGLQRLARVRGLHRRHGLWRTAGHDATAACAAFGTEIDQPVCFGEHLEVVFDHEHRGTALHKPVHHLEQALHVRHVQADGGLVQQVQRLWTPDGRRLALHAGEFRHEFDALGFTTRECRAWLAQTQIAKPHLAQQFQRPRDGGMCFEEDRGIGDAHVEHLADAALAVAHFERFAVEARATALLAGHAHIGQEAHLYLLHALPFAGLASAAGRVEGKTARREAAQTRLGCVRVELADGVPHTDVGCRAGTRRLADGGLVHLEHALDLLPALERATALPLQLALALRRERGAQVGLKYLAHQRALAAAAHAG